jgi:hypothetical protein
MATTYNRLLIDVNEKIDDIVTAKQNDTASRFLDVSLYDNGTPIDLTGQSVKIYFKKPDDTEVFTEGEITDATAGRCQFELTTQTLAAYGDLQAEISIWDGDTEVLTTQTFIIYVLKMLRSDNTVESTNEFGVLVTLFQSIQNSFDLMNAIKINFGEAGEKAAEYGATTFWEMLEVLAERTEEAVQYDVSGKIGTSEDTTDDTVFGKINGLDEEIVDAIVGGSQTFTSNSSFTVPAGVKSIRVTAAGGGGGGGGYTQGAGGGGGACIVKKLFNVIPGQVLSITVGKGGSGGYSSSSDTGESGSATIIGNLVTLAGGGGGQPDEGAGGIAGGDGGGAGGAGGAHDTNGFSGGDGAIGEGGAGGSSSYGYNGGGGGGSYGDGGQGCSDDSNNAEDGGIGAGGGGAGDYSTYGGDGGDGIVIIGWGLGAL